MRRFSRKQVVIVFEFKHKKTDKAEYFILIGCKSDELKKNDELFNFWLNKFLNKETELKIFGVTVWSLRALVKQNTFLDIQSICLYILIINFCG